MLSTTFGVLTFRLTPEEYDRLGVRHLLFGLVTAWIVGYGRWWDRPDTISMLLRSGALSVIIVFALGGLLHVVTGAIRPRRRGPIKTTAYVALTSLPAAVYAIPLESWMDLERARTGNLTMLAIVAFWRVALYVYFLRRICDFKIYATIVTALLPLSVVLFTLAINGLMFSVLNLMTGDRQTQTPVSTAETRYEVILFLGACSIYVAPVTFLLWVALALKRRNSSTLEAQPKHLRGNHDAF